MNLRLDYKGTGSLDGLISDALEKGAKTCADVSEALRKQGVKLSGPKVHEYSTDAGIDIPLNSRAFRRKIDLKAVHDAYAEGYTSRRGLARATRLPMNRINRLLRGLDLETTMYDDPNRVQHLRDGTPHKDVAKRAGCRVPQVSAALANTPELREEWRANNKTYSKRLKSSRQLLTWTLSKIGAEQVSDINSQALDACVKFYDNSRLKKTDIETVFAVYRDYFDLASQGKQKSVEWFAEKYHVSGGLVLRLFDKADLEPMYGSHADLFGLTDEQQSAVAVSKTLDMHPDDLAYFIGVSSEVYGFNCNRRAPERRCGERSGTTTVVSFKDASELYELIDGGFSSLEIMDCLGLEPHQFTHYFTKHTEYAGKIVDALRVMFPEREVIKPYITWNRAKKAEKLLDTYNLSEVA